MSNMSQTELEQARREWTGEAQREAQPALQRRAVQAVAQGRGQMPAPVFGKRKPGVR